MSAVCLQNLFFLVLVIAPDATQFSGETMGTTWHVTVNAAAPDDLKQTIQAELDRVDRLMSNWREDSEISRFGAYEGTDWFAVSAETASVVGAAIEVSRATDGAFDVTVSPLIELWNFGAAVNTARIPDGAAIAAAREHVGWRLIEARESPPGLRKQDPKVTINLSAIAKGYAVDRVAAAVSNAGFDSWLVEVGGEVRARGQSPKGRPWTIGVEEPMDDARRIRSAVPLDGQSMATSGDYRNFFMIDGRRYSHTIDPRTGQPVTHSLASVSVLAPDCMQADAWATAITVLGPEAGAAMAAERGLAAMLLVRTDRGFETQVIGAFPGTPVDTPPSAPEPGGSLIVFVTALVVFLVAIAGMAIGVILSNKRLKGSCGGLAGMTDGSGKTACDLCAMPSPECRGEQAEQPVTPDSLADTRAGT